jgi:hypothetical protein
MTMMTMTTVSNFLVDEILNLVVELYRCRNESESMHCKNLTASASFFSEFSLLKIESPYKKLNKTAFINCNKRTVQPTNMHLNPESCLLCSVVFWITCRLNSMA